MITRNQIDAAISMIETAAEEVERVYNDGKFMDFTIEYERDDGKIGSVDSIRRQYENGDVSSFSFLDNGDFLFSHSSGAGEGVISIMCSLDTDTVKSYAFTDGEEDE